MKKKNSKLSFFQRFQKELLTCQYRINKLALKLNKIIVKVK